MSTLIPTRLTKPLNPEDVQKIRSMGSERESSSARSNADRIATRVEKTKPNKKKQRVETLKTVMFGGLSAMPALLILSFLFIMVFVL